MVIDYIEHGNDLLWHANEEPQSFVYDANNNLHNTALFPAIQEKISVTRTRNVKRFFKTVQKEFTEEEFIHKPISKVSYVSQGDDAFLKYDNRSWSLYLKFNEQGMPVLNAAPQTIEEVCDLLKTDPRFISQIDPYVVIGSPNHSAIIREACSQGLRNVLGYQSQFGVMFTEEEAEIRSEFADTVAKGLDKFLQNCVIARKNLDVTKSNIHSEERYSAK